MDDKIKSIVSQLSLKEKVDLMAANYSAMGFCMRFLAWGLKYNHKPYAAAGVKRLGILPMKFADGPRGVVMGNSTCFPVAMARGASWDTELEERVAQAIGVEIRAGGGNYFGGVCINLPRHPAWGRAQEVYGEDPHLLGEFGAASVRGVQYHNVMACAKHYALNSMENARFKVDVQCSERTLREIYLPHFKRCVDEGAASIMGAYNKFRGEHCCHSRYLLTDILKEEWGFNGFTISDFVWGVRETLPAANAGLDIEMPFVQKYGKKLVKAVEKGLVPLTQIDDAAGRIIATVKKFTEAPDPQEYTKNMICGQPHIDLALEAAEKGMVLLQNRNDTLPLKIDNLKTLAVVGKLADVENIGDHGSSRVRPPYIITPLQGLKKHLGSSCEILHTDGNDLEAAKELVKKADAVIYIVGYTHGDEGEFISDKMDQGGDRKSISLHQDEIDLLNTLGPLNKNSGAALIGGSTIIIEEWKANISAILMAWYPGMEGGTALANILFGKVNPGGKMPSVIPKDASQLPFFDPQAESIEYEFYHGYTLFDKEGYEASIPFGFGLSYTTFECGVPTVSKATYIHNDTIEISMDVKNVGNREGEEVPQLYIGYENSAVERHVKDLRAFKKVKLKPGESTTVKFTLKPENLAYYNPEEKKWVAEAITYLAHVGNSSAAADLKTVKFSITE